MYAFARAIARVFFATVAFPKATEVLLAGQWAGAKRSPSGLNHADVFGWVGASTPELIGEILEAGPS
jgi:hypothetical protein